jgi:hypothetical protein
MYWRIIRVANFIVDLNHKHTRNDMGRETVNGLIEEVRAVRESAAAAPTCHRVVSESQSVMEGRERM